jgi:hypothetical protein
MYIPLSCINTTVKTIEITGSVEIPIGKYVVLHMMTAPAHIVFTLLTTRLASPLL